jgi:hypothetical protein
MQLVRTTVHIFYYIKFGTEDLVGGGDDWLHDVVEHSFSKEVLLFKLPASLNTVAWRVLFHISWASRSFKIQLFCN